MKMTPKEWSEKLQERVRTGKCLWIDTTVPLGEIACVELDSGEIHIWGFSHWTGEFIEEINKE